MTTTINTTTTTMLCHGRKIVSLATVIAAVILLLHGSSQRNRQLRHNYSHSSNFVVTDPRSVARKPEIMSPSLSQLRYASFGTSRSWGTGLEDRDTEAYVRILSPEFGQNFGLAAAREDIPATCLASMIGDENIFDVIVMEFVTFNKFRHLAKRLRARFPDAIIIALEIMNLNMCFNKPDQLQLREYMKERGYKDLQDPAFHKHLREETKVSDWVNLFTTKKELEYRDKVMEEVGGHVVRFPVPVLYEDPREFIIQNAKYFGHRVNPADPMHPSKLGHEEIANRIQQMLLELDPSLLAPSDTLGPWIYGKDRCISWYENGITEGLTVDRMNHIEWADGGKHGLEVDRMGGFIEFESHSEGVLHVTYMIMGPEPGHYPRCKLKVESAEPGQWASPPVEIDPHITDNYHITVMSPPVGIVKPGMNRLWVFALEHDTEHPFRITGISISHEGDSDEAVTLR